MAVMGMTQRALATSLGVSHNGTAIFASNMSRERAAKIAISVNSNILAALAQSDVYWDRITSIEPDGMDDVYDLTVPGYHNFVAANIIVHNSIEQDADVVMFIYREAYYNKQTDRENITDILIKKHRNGPIGDIELYFHPEQRRFANLERFQG
jgi:replicative DNA helicase